MLFGKLLPREGNYFEMFNQHADRIVEAARAFSMLVANYSDLHLRHKTFITPDRPRADPRLINTMDDVADLLQDSAETMALYDIHQNDRRVVRLTDLRSSAASVCATR
jgi:hypothetical protein